MTRRVVDLNVALLSPDPPSGPAHDPDAHALAAELRSLVSLGALTSDRSLQRAVGPSQVGCECPRQLAYLLADAPPVNITDPLRALVGVGVHAAMADLFRRLDRGAGRFLVETPVMYRAVRGTCDLYDRLSGTVVDWKTTLKAKLSKLRADGPSAQYRTQVQVYGAGMVCAGEAVQAVALAHVPIDGTLDDLFVWRAPYDRGRADRAIDRLDTLGSMPLKDVDGRLRPSTVEARPSALCPWCDHYRPGSATSDLACAGKERN